MSHTSWYHIPESKTLWLLDGLFLADGYSALIGKPKAGKSTFLRSLIVSVIKSRPLIGRSVNVPSGKGRVLYLHLDRKDSISRVAKELRELGITEKESERLTLRTSKDMPSADYAERLVWLQREVKAAKPHLIVIDLLWQFVIAKNSNDYNATLQGINQLQDALIAMGYNGALIVTLHGRKSESTTDSFDDALGSTGQRGSFSTNIMLKRHRKDSLDGKYTIESDQTERDDLYGEIPETVLVRNPDKSYSLGQSLKEIVIESKQSQLDADKDRLAAYLDGHPKSREEAITSALKMSRPHFRRVMRELGDYVTQSGKGTRGNPYLYSTSDLGITDGSARDNGEGNNTEAVESAKELVNDFK